LRRYETIFITYPDLPEEEITGLVERYSAIIKDRQGIIVKVEKWGKRKLAYEIEKQARGFYVLIDFVGTPAIVTEFERNLRIADKILKFMTVKTQEAVNLEALDKEMNPPAVEAKVEPAPAPEEGVTTPPAAIEAAETAAVEAKESEAALPESAGQEGEK
jgi:small subunit ribosomal protein S6